MTSPDLRPASAALAVNHVGVTVPDVFGAIDWYGDVFGFRCIMGPRLLEPDHREAAASLGPRFRRAWQAHLLCGNGVGIELFQFIDPPVQHRDADDPIDFTRRGPWHLCLTYLDVAQAVALITDEGGTMLSEPTAFVPGRPWVLAYCADPWGTVLEIMSHSYAEVFSNWPQPGQAEPPILIERP
ncbi:glyoxalase/bleomycin resistance protein [Mycolicibacterium canariasense]|uniref:Glyoxalase/bleomycin resistance protein n=1 Tax=Mycolicibacterium canariasense TaxID=228230 RepID=A0A100W8L4_MYCCR|nr:VOC family protein [Mycolicibacterium canariasense]GAS93832.1 glyoxalase/bleomycin resistance protein [Mycolicibacterium canariasense]